MTRLSLVSPLALLLATSANGQDVPPQAFPGYMDFQGRYLAVLSDADMVASAYNGPPLGPRTAAMVDTLTLFPLDGGLPGAPVTIPVTNAVTAWPSLLGFSADGRTAYVAETERPAGPDDQSRADLDPSGLLSVVAIGGTLAGEVVQEVDTASRAVAVAVHPAGEILAVATTDTGTPSVGIFPILEDGRLGEMTIVPLADAETDPPHIEWNPAGDMLAITMAGADRVRFYAWDGEVLTAHGNAVGSGKLPGPGHWSPDGRHFFVTHLLWGGDVERVFYGAELSTLAAIRVAPVGAEDPQHVMVSAVGTGAAAEEFAISPDGTTLVTLNMERSYAMPDDPALTYYASLTLVTWDAAAERLYARGTFPFEGILPEGITFDASGDFLAVANFAHFNPLRPVEEATVDIWRVVDGIAPLLVQTDLRLPVMRGAHVAKIVN